MVRELGGDLRYIAMDELYYFGYQDASGCHQSAAELAANVAQSVARARRIFPNVVIGDIADPDTLLALELNGEALDLDHGYPVRLIAPDRPGVLQTKWIHRVVVL